MLFYNKQTDDNETIYYADVIFEGNNFRELKPMNSMDVRYMIDLFKINKKAFDGLDSFNEEYFKDIELVEILISLRGLRWFRRSIEKEKITMDFLLRGFKLIDINELIPQLKRRKILSSEDITTLELMLEIV